MILPVLLVARVGTQGDAFVFAAWACWSVPLLIAELFIQGRKILAVRSI